ncbi:hypothetical protein Ga0080559_TMP226 (plasmid) [Salipiger profundus]|uniref:Uncharacterized protein n=1 Tax=Salipiger profundus TaxID=1229727 RepID=A0A1U7DDL4_9RHOB|nr:hypothetical protein Ga0080559_TMP226 [Salipiger profundus]
MVWDRQTHQKSVRRAIQVGDTYGEISWHNLNPAARRAPSFTVEINSNGPQMIFAYCPLMAAA